MREFDLGFIGFSSRHPGAGRGLARRPFPIARFGFDRKVRVSRIAEGPFALGPGTCPHREKRQGVRRGDDPFNALGSWRTENA